MTNHKIQLGRLLGASYTIVYKLPLGHEVQTWTTEDFNQFVRKWAMLTMNKVSIIDAIIQYERLKR